MGAQNHGPELGAEGLSVRSCLLGLLGLLGLLESRFETPSSTKIVLEIQGHACPHEWIRNPKSERLSALDRFNVELTGKERPRVLFIPTAASDSPGYCRTFREIYGGRLGCEVETLLLGSSDREPAVIEDKIGTADLVYVGGSSPLRLMTVWRRLGVDKLLRRADLGWACDDLTAVWRPTAGGWKSAASDPGPRSGWSDGRTGG